MSAIPESRAKDGEERGIRDSARAERRDPGDGRPGPTLYKQGNGRWEINANIWTAGQGVTGRPARVRGGR